MSGVILLLISSVLGHQKIDGEISQDLQFAAVMATVSLYNPQDQTKGSGILIGHRENQHYILTAQHLVPQKGNVEIAVFSLGSYPRPRKVYRAAEVVARTTGIQDLALVKVETADSMPGYLTLCPSKQGPEISGQCFLTVGMGDGEGPTCVRDRVLGKKMVSRLPGKEKRLFWEIDRKHPEGRSGGGLVDLQGNLAGICSGTNLDKTYFTHLVEIRTFLEENQVGWLIPEKRK